MYNIFKTGLIMKIKNIGEQPTFKTNWTQRQVNQTKLTQIYLNNGNRLSVRETQHYKLQTLYNKYGEWVRSKLRFFKGRQIINEIRSHNNANQMD